MLILMEVSLTDSLRLICISDSRSGSGPTPGTHIFVSTRLLQKIS